MVYRVPGQTGMVGSNDSRIRFVKSLCLLYLLETLVSLLVVAEVVFVSSFKM